MKPLDLVPRRRKRRLPVVLASLAALSIAAAGLWLAFVHEGRENLTPEAEETADDAVPFSKPTGPHLRRPPAGRDRFGDRLPPGAVRRLGSIRLRHGSPVRGLAFLDDGRVLVSGGEDETVSLWDVETGKELHRTERPGWMKALAVARLPDREALAVVGRGDTVYVLDPSTGSPLARYLIDVTNRHPTGDARRLAFSPDGKALVVLRQDGSLLLWDLVAGVARPPGPLPGAVFATFDPHGALVLATGDGTVEVRHPRTGQPLQRWSIPSGGDVFALSGDGRLLAALSEGRLTLFELKTGAEVRKLELRGVLRSLAFSPDQRRLASGTTVRIVFWDIETGERLQEIPRGTSAENLVFSPDGRMLAWGDRYGRIHRWNLERDEPYREVDPDAHSGAIASIDFDEADEMLVSGGADGTLREWNLRTGDLRSRNLGAPIALVSYLSSDRLLAVERESYHLWDRQTGFEVSEVPFGEARRNFAVGGDTLVSGRPGGLERWDLRVDSVESLRIDPEERLLAVSPSGETVALVRSSRTLVLRDRRGVPIAERVAPNGSRIFSLCFLPGGQRLVSNNALWMWQGEALTAFPNYPRGSLCAVSPFTKLLATSGHDRRSVELHDLTRRPDRQITREMVIGEHRGRVSSLAFSTNGQILASAGSEGTILIWDRSETVPLGEPVEVEAGPRDTSVTEAAPIRIDFDATPLRGQGIVTTHVSDPTGERALRLIGGVEGRAALWRGLLEFPETADVRMDGAYTIQLRFRLEPGEDGKLPAFQSVLETGPVSFSVREGRPMLFFRRADGGHQQASPFDSDERIEVGRWYQLAVTHDPETREFRIYFDGALRDTERASGSRMEPFLGSLRLGGFGGGTSFHGAFDELVIDDKVRSHARIAEAAGLDAPVVKTTRSESKNLEPHPPPPLPAEEPILDEDVTALVRIEEHESFTAYHFTGALTNTKTLDLAVAQGLVWLATDRGVLRHDPADGSFRLYGSNAGAPGTLIWKVAPTGPRLALSVGRYTGPGTATNIGTFVFEPMERTWEQIRFGDSRELTWDGERLWSGTGVLDLASGAIERFTVGPGGLLHRSVNAIERLGNSVFFGMRGDYVQETKGFTGGGVSRLELGTGEWKSYTPAQGLARGYTNALSVEVDEVWAVHFHEEVGISRLDRAADVWTSYTKSPNGVELGGTGVKSDEKTVWIGQQGAFVVLNKSTMRAVAYDRREGAPGYIISGMGLGPDFLWAGAYTHGRDGVMSSGMVRFPRR